MAGAVSSCKTGNSARKLSWALCEGRTEIGKVFYNSVRICIKVVCEISTSIKIEGTLCFRNGFVV